MLNDNYSASRIYELKIPRTLSNSLCAGSKHCINDAIVSLPFDKVTVHHYREVDSTNIIARQLAKSGAAEGTIVVCEAQTAGKGRMTRRWVCPHGRGLLFSVILRPQIKPANISLLTLLAGVVVADAIRLTSGCPAGIKWPNDVLVKGKKICGILGESKVSRNNTDFAVIGIGVNVNLNKEDFPEDFRDLSTSLKIETGRQFCRSSLLTTLMQRFAVHYGSFLSKGFEYLKDQWLLHNVTIGKTVRITRSDTEQVTGKALNINQNGALTVRLSDGTVEDFMAGDVSIGTGNLM